MFNATYILQCAGCELRMQYHTDAISFYVICVVDVIWFIHPYHSILLYYIMIGNIS